MSDVIVDEIVEAFCKKIKRSLKDIEKINRDEEMSPDLAGFQIGVAISEIDRNVKILDAYFDSLPDGPSMPRLNTGVVYGGRGRYDYRPPIAGRSPLRPIRYGGAPVVHEED